MKIAYLMNTYPLPSTTFIRREIEAHEHAGHIPERFAIRAWDSDLVDTLDVLEAAKVDYLLGKGSRVLIMSSVFELISNPIGMARAIQSAFFLGKARRKARWKSLAYLIEAVQLKRAAQKKGVNHIHSHFSTNSAAVAMISRQLGGPSYSFTVHGPDELWEMQENALTLKMRYASLVVAISEYCHFVIDKHTNGKFQYKTEIVRCGLDLENFVGSGSVPDCKTLVCVGRLCEAKSQHRLVEAFANIVPRHPTARLVLVGDGELRPVIENTIHNRNLGERVAILGWKPNNEVRKLLKESRALVLPSIAEGLPIAIMESFALGRPVLSSDVNGIPELVDATCGWLVDPNSVESIELALDELLSASPKKLTSMAQIGKARVEALHDQSKNASQLRSLILASSDVN